jgi:hypothetical protein
VLAELKKEATARIDAAATAGRLTPDQANQQKAQLDQRLNTVVDQVMPQRGPGRGADGEDPNG